MFSQATVFAYIRVGNFLAYNVVCETMLLKGSLFKKCLFEPLRKKIVFGVEFCLPLAPPNKKFFKSFFLTQNERERNESCTKC